jgi:hypothetical protein
MYVKIKIVIILVEKLESRVDQGQGSGHGSGRSTRVDPSQHINKNNYYYSFKTRLESRPVARSRSRVGLIVDLS